MIGMKTTKDTEHTKTTVKTVGKYMVYGVGLAVNLN